MATPLSEASLAHRAVSPAGQDPVIHVTIGRIDVVANLEPTVAGSATGRRTRTPRTPTVPLADYLRGRRDGGGGRE